jgi:hypothetical protein
MGDATRPTGDPRRELAEAVRRRCLETALAAWEEGGAAGLCAEGRWELVIAALRGLDPAADDPQIAP